MIWFSASCSFTNLPNSVGLLALPLRITSADGSNRLTILPSLRLSPWKDRYGYDVLPLALRLQVVESVNNASARTDCPPVSSDASFSVGSDSGLQRNTSWWARHPDETRGHASDEHCRCLNVY